MTARERFKAVQDEIDAIEAESTPLRQERDALLAEMQGQEQALVARIKAIEMPHLSDLKAELSRLARELGGRRMNESE